MTVASFPFDSLKKISTKNLVLEKALSRIFPKAGEGSDLTSHMEAAFLKIIGSPLRLSFENRFDTDYDHFLRGLSEQMVCLSLSMIPSNKKIFVEVDADIIFSLVDKMLGGKGSLPKISHQLTPLEEGVVQFFVVRFLKEISEYWKNSGEAPQLSLRLDRLIFKSEIMEGLCDKLEPMLMATYRVRWDTTTSFVRICLPHPVLNEWMQNTQDTPQPVEPDLSWKNASVGSLRTLVWAEAGLVNINMGELKRLQRGDVILFDEFYPDFDGEKMNGPVILRFGDEPVGGVEGELRGVGDSNTITLKNVIR